MRELERWRPSVEARASRLRSALWRHAGNVRDLLCGWPSESRGGWPVRRALLEEGIRIGLVYLPLRRGSRSSPGAPDDHSTLAPHEREEFHAPRANAHLDGEHVAVRVVHGWHCRRALQVAGERSVGCVFSLSPLKPLLATALSSATSHDLRRGRGAQLHVPKVSPPQNNYHPFQAPAQSALPSLA